MAPEPSEFFRADPHGITLNVRLTPKGGRDAIDGVERLSDGRAVLKIRVRAAPSEGDANASLLALLAKSLKVAPRQVSLIGGATARLKRIRIDGDVTALVAMLTTLASGGRS